MPRDSSRSETEGFALDWPDDQDRREGLERRPDHAAQLDWAHRSHGDVRGNGGAEPDDNGDDAGKGARAEPLLRVRLKARGSSPGPTTPERDDREQLQAMVTRLEAEVRDLRSQLRELRDRPEST